MRDRRWKVVALLATGITIAGVSAGSPAGAHVGGTVNHLRNHVRPNADARYERPVISPASSGAAGAVNFPFSPIGADARTGPRNLQNELWAAVTRSHRQ